MRDIIERAERLGLKRDDVIRELLQKLILYSLAYTNLDKYYIFQGGTALRIIYGSPRFSLDIDFTLISRDVEMIYGDIKKIRNVVTKVVMIDDIDVGIVGEKMFEEENLYRCFFSFGTTKYLGKKIRVKVEINRGIYKEVEFIKKLVDIEYPFKTSIGVMVKNPNQLLADKLASLAGGIHRDIVRWRDIFDIYWLREKLDAKLDKNYFRQEFGSWIEELEDIKEIILRLRGILRGVTIPKQYRSFRDYFLPLYGIRN